MASSILPNTTLDILGQLPNLNIYTQVALTYQLSDTSPTVRQKIETILQTGLTRLSVAFPWIAARVSTKDSSPTSTGTFHFAPHLSSPTLIIKDLTNSNEFPQASFDELEARAFPMSMLPEEVFAQYPQ